MRRYVKVTHVPGKVTCKVTLVDGDLSAQWTFSSYLGNVGPTVLAAEKQARRALDEVRAALEPEAS